MWILRVAGVGIVGYSDEREKGEETLVGDLLTLLGAAFFAAYTVSLKFWVGRDERINMPMFFGFVGIFNIVVGIPCLLFLHLTKIEPFSIPSPRTFGLLTLNGSLGTVLSDYLWARSVLLTTPVISTLATSMCVPLSFLVDTFFRNETFNGLYRLGLVFVVVGFIGANVSESRLRAA